MFAAYLADRNRPDGRYHQRKHRRDSTARIDFPHFGCQARLTAGSGSATGASQREIARNVVVPVGDAPWSLKTPILNAAFWPTNESCKSSFHIWPNRNRNSWTG